MSEVLGYAALFVGVLLALRGASDSLGLNVSKAERTIERRLRTLASGADPADVLRLLRRQREPEGLERVPILAQWPALVAQSHVGWRAETMLAGTLLGSVVIFLLALLWLPWLIALSFALLIGIGGPTTYLRHRRDRRRLELVRQLPDAIDLMVQSLRVGHPLNAAFQVITREMPEPIASELKMVADAITYGDELTTAVEDMAARIGTEEFNQLAVAINIQHGTGGNLATVLETLSGVIRDRFAMVRKINALAAEGNLTAVVVSLIPVVLAVFLHLMAPGYYAEVADDPLFLPLIALGVLATVINAAIMRRMVRFHF